jgi:hypothetical protein
MLSVNCVVAAFAHPDPHRLFDRLDEDLAVADAAGLGGGGDERDDLVGDAVGDDDLELHLRQELHGVLTAAVHLGVPLLAAESSHLAHGHADDAGLREGVLHVVELERLDDCLDLLQVVFSSGCGLRRRRPTTSSAPAPLSVCVTSLSRDPGWWQQGACRHRGPTLLRT